MTNTTKPYSGWDRKVVAIAVIWALTAPVAVVFGAPPSGLLAQDTRPKADLPYRGYTGKKWDRDFGVIEGRCDRQVVVAVVGRSASARADKDDGRQVATVVGAMGPSTGMMDEKDRACVGHALELAGVERGVAWTNNDNGMRYRVMPLGGFTDMGKSCREFVTRITTGGRDETVRHKACSAGDGIWQIAG